MRKPGTRSPEPGTPTVRQLVPRLLTWFAASARNLPWRRTRDPYAIWVSEVMLQQTQVNTVIPYWERWLRELPTIESAARVSDAKLHKLWEGLGYYTRVRNLQRAAQQILARHNGRFPENFDDILALPGIGRYTAGAIASIAFNQPRPILDGNVIRVLTRIFGIAADPREKKTNARLWELAEEAVLAAARFAAARDRRHPQAHSSNRQSAIGNRESSQSLRTMAEPNQAACSHLNQSLMELGALVCTPRAPACAICPVARICLAQKQGLQEQLPNLGARAVATRRRFLAFVIARDGKFLVRQRPAGVVNAHLWEFPNIELPMQSAGRRLDSSVAVTRLASATTNVRGLRLGAAKPICTVKHSITRYRITLEAWRMTTAAGAPVSDPARADGGSRGAPGQSRTLPGRWLSLRQLHRLAFSSAHRRILESLEPLGHWQSGKRD